MKRTETKVSLENTKDVADVLYERLLEWLEVDDAEAGVTLTALDARSFMVQDNTSGDDYKVQVSKFRKAGK